MEYYITMSKKLDIEKQLRNAIQESGMTLSQLEQDTGIARGAISRFVRGQRSIGITIAAKLAKALDMRLVYKDQVKAKGGKQ